MHIQDAATTPTALRAKEVETVSRQFEASFLAEMLRFSGIGQSMGDYGGGVGEQYFAPLLADFYAESLVKAGGVGISERVAAALLKGSSLDE